MKNKMIISIAAIIVVIIGLVIAMKSDDQYTIGVLGDFSSTASGSSVDTMLATELALEKLNDLHSYDRYRTVQININEISDKKDLEEMIDRFEVDLILGPTTSGQYVRVYDSIAQSSVPVFSIAVSSIIGEGKVDSHFRLSGLLEQQAEDMTYCAASHFDGPITIFYSEENSAFTETLTSLVAYRLNAMSIQVDTVMVGDLMDEGVQGVLLSKNYEGLGIIIAGPGKAGIIAKMISINNPTIEFLMSSWSESMLTMEQLQDVDNDAYLLAAVPIKDSLLQSQVTLLLERDKGTEFSTITMLSYETIHFIDNMINEIGGLRLDKVQSYIHNMATYQGKFVDFTFNDTGDGARAYAFAKVEGMELIYIEDVIDSVNGTSKD